MSVRVLALIATYGRPALLRRALAALRAQGPALAGVVVVNNGGDAETAAVAEDFAAVRGEDGRKKRHGEEKFPDDLISGLFLVRTDDK